MKTFNRVITTALMLCLLSLPAIGSDDRFSGVPRVVAMGDVHGKHQKLTRMLSKADIIDAELSWDAGAAHLVMMGDMVDRGPDSRRVLDLLMRLQEEARDAGGRVHVLLGNHETMWLTGDYRYTSDADYRSFADDETEAMREAARERFEIMKEQGRVEGDFDSKFPPGTLALREALAPDGRYGSWLMEQPAMVVVNDTAFIHAGLSEEYAGASAAELNRRVREELKARIGAWRELSEAGILAPEYPLLSAARALESHLEDGAFDRQPRKVRSAAETVVGAPESLIFDPNGPFWYRGNAVCNELAESAVVDQALEGLGTESLVISHTPTPNHQVIMRLDDRLIRIETGDRPSALVLEADNRHALYADRDEPSPVAVDDSHPLSNSGMSAEDIEAFLSEAEIVSREDVGIGVTNPQRVTLEHKGARMRAIFKTVFAPPYSPTGMSDRRLIDLSDRHTYELAAYRLDRLLGLDMVPPAVERRIGQATGTLQYWVEDATNDRERRQQDIEPDAHCPLDKSYTLLELFDRLIYNTDRTQENILYTPDWRVALIDHTRAFRTRTGIPDNVREVSLDEAPALAEQLEQLDHSKLKRELGEFLGTRQIRAILKRRDEMLAEWRQAAAGAVSAR